MTEPGSTDFTASDGRRFAFPVGAAFLALSGILLFKGSTLGFRTVAGLGVALLSAGAVVPSKLGPLQRAWMRMALAVSTVTTPVFMGLVYFVVVTPTGWLMRLCGRNAVRHEPVDGSFWKSTADRPEGDLTRQF